MRKFLSAVLAAALLLAASACGGTETPSDTTGGDTTGDNSTAPAETQPEYVYPEVDLGGETFSILNTAQTYGFYDHLDFDTATGETLDDAIYNRNRDLEERFGFVLEIDYRYKLADAAAALQTAVLANEDAWDVCYLRDYYISSAITEGYFMNLSEIDGFRFDNPWWDYRTMKEVSLGGGDNLLFALNDVSLTDFEGTCVTFFNEEILKNIGMDAPYQLVLDGKWTLDKFGEYLKAGAALNGADSFSWKTDGETTYGMVGFQRSEDGLLYGAGCQFVAMVDDYPTVVWEDERFAGAAEKVIRMLSTEGEYIYLNNAAAGQPDHYESAFKNGRGLMMIAQLKAANSYRDMEDGYGIVPIPKLDAAQDRYYNIRSYSYVMALPITNSIPEETAAIMDAMSYVTYKDVMPAFYDGKLSQKLLRSEESVEMLDIIRESRCFDIASPYGWMTQPREVIHNAVMAKSPEISSALASLKLATEASIDKIMDALNG